MRRLATFAWRSPPPTSVDEILAIFDDDTARLVVRRPRTLSGPIGTFVVKLGEDDVATLTGAGPGPVVIDVLGQVQASAPAAVLALAERTSAAARAKPRATATFRASPVAAVAAGTLAMALLVEGGGRKAVQFELEPRRCMVHFSRAGVPVASFPLPELRSGFVSPDGEGFGGLRRRAKVGPGAYAATAFDVPAPADATAVSIDVAGWLVEALPDERTPEPFDVRTDDTPIPGSAASPADGR